MHVIATAGHVDHGKSALVRALTGMEPDRWEEEQRRGMTLDLGFAWTVLPSGHQVAFVDVPGHERFVANMLAGAGPAPAVLFVVAADEGWMPQSAEHLAAIDALGVRTGLLAVTRSDLADPGPALQEASAQIARSSLGKGEPVEAVAVSAVTGNGLDALTAALSRLAGRLPAPDPDDGVRLWLDRVFAIKGSGTVVTGTLQAGTVSAGDELMLTPSMRPVRIRSVQSLGEPAARVTGVARVALNLRGVSASEVSRGMALVQAGRWTMTAVIDVRLTAAGAGERFGDPPAGEPAARPANEPRLPPAMTLHIGAARTVARVRVIGGGLARLTLDHPLPLHVGDRVLLRDPGAPAARIDGDRTGGRPICGATVLDVMPPALRRTGAAAAARQQLSSWPERPGAADLLGRHRLLRSGAATAMGLQDLPAPVSGDWLADSDHWQLLRQRLVVLVAENAKRDPLAPGLPVDAARAALGLPDRGLVEALAASREGTRAAELVRLNAGYLQPSRTPGRGQPARPRHRGHRSRRRPCVAALPSAVATAVQRVLEDLAHSPFSAPDTDRLRELGLDARAAAAAERLGLLCRLPGNVILPPDATARAARILAGIAAPFTVSEARQALQSSRRVVVPLLELLDRQGVTRRLADDRRTLRE
jgi:selenocysteine-specific elongation factor